MTPIDATVCPASEPAPAGGIDIPLAVAVFGRKETAMVHQSPKLNITPTHLTISYNDVAEWEFGEDTSRLTFKFALSRDAITTLHASWTSGLPGIILGIAPETAVYALDEAVAEMTLWEPSRVGAELFVGAFFTAMTDAELQKLHADVLVQQNFIWGPSTSMTTSSFRESCKKLLNEDFSTTAALPARSAYAQPQDFGSLEVRQHADSEHDGNSSEWQRGTILSGDDHEDLIEIEKDVWIALGR